ncbi:MAG: hypothetical protein JNL48_17405 [Acidobacteria bacterium]|nr:hypothetical protein [Acidobacteriota bacterium]
MSTADGDWVFHAPDGRRVPNVPPVPELAGTGSVQAGDIAWDEGLAIPVWDGSPFDVAWALDVLYAP